MNRTYMQKGIGAAPFAIVAALIVALTAGIWLTQTTQAAAVKDVSLTVEDVADSTTFNDPEQETDGAFGPTAVAETGTGVEAAAAEAGVVFRAAAQSGGWVEVTTRVVDSVDDSADGDPANGYTDIAHNLQITVDGEASLSSTSTLTSATCATQAIGSDGPTDGGRATDDQVCQFPVWASGTAGAFSVTAADAGGTSILTTDVVGADGSLSGQWVGPAVAATVLDGAPAESAIADPADATDVQAAEQFGSVSPAAFLSGTVPGLMGGQAGFLFQLTDAAGQVALDTSDDVRDDLRIRVLTDTGDDLTLAAVMSVGTAGATAYVNIGDEGDFRPTTTYPGLTADAADAGGLIAVGLTAVDPGDAALGRIVLDIPGGGSVEHAFAIAGDPDADMSTVSAISGDVNLAPGGSHERTLTLRDANGSVVTGLTENVSTDDTPTPRSGASFVTLAADEDADITLAIATKETSAGTGAYKITITAVCGEDDTTTAVACDGDEDDDAEVGLHGFSVTIDEKKKSADEDGNPLEAHVGSGITGLSITGVTNAAGDDILGDNGEVSVGEFELITITLTATGSDGAAPINDSVVTPATGSGFVGTDAAVTKMTDDNGEVTVNYGSGTETRRISFTGGTGSVQLLVRVGSADAPADAGPRVYPLADSAGGDLHTWNGGDASSAEFENVANLVIVWKWTGNMWVGYTSNPNAPAATKTNYTLSNGDHLWVVANGAVDLLLD